MIGYCPDYETAKRDFEYFMRLVDLVMAYYRDGIEGANGSMAE